MRHRKVDDFIKENFTVIFQLPTAKAFVRDRNPPDDDFHREVNSRMDKDPEFANAIEEAKRLEEKTRLRSNLSCLFGLAFIIGCIALVVYGVKSCCNSKEPPPHHSKSVPYSPPGSSSYSSNGSSSYPSSYVDLNLPSGTLWASKNLGASSHTDVGDYYTRHDISASSSFDVSSLPTIDQMKELHKYCTWVWTNSYQGSGVKGYIVSSKRSDSQIFLPAAGNVKNGNYRRRNTDGDYWLANSKGADRAYNLDFTQTYIKTADHSPATMGFSVRLVSK